RATLLEALTWESRARDQDPLRGSFGVALDLHQHNLALQGMVAHLTQELQQANALAATA
ncbi:hypothetical protein A2U01_0076375, partial [Trifolium medium]|nr:hypothetical protein [Trifolium medium]